MPAIRMLSGWLNEVEGGVVEVCRPYVVSVPNSAQAVTFFSKAVTAYWATSAFAVGATLVDAREPLLPEPQPNEARIGRMQATRRWKINRDLRIEWYPSELCSGPLTLALCDPESRFFLSRTMPIIHAFCCRATV